MRFPGRSSRIRFKPPQIESTAELDWLLQAAFAKSFPPAFDSDRHELTLLQAHRLDLSAAIGARLRDSPRPEAMPTSLAEDFRRSHAESAIRTALHEKTARRIAEVARRLSIPIVFLKGFALFIAGRDRRGGRKVGDLDLLAPSRDASRLHSELRHHGYPSEGELGNEHHLATLLAPEGGKVDLHFCLRGLCLQGSKWATWKDLSDHGVLVSAKDYPGDCSIPSLGVQTAHLLVHGLAHHAWRPHRYPLLRLVGDLLELVPDDSTWEDFLLGFGEILLRSVRKPELEAIHHLALQLREGRIPDLRRRNQNSTAILLRHMLAGSLDDEYGPRLGTRHTLGRLGEAVRRGRLLHYLIRRVRR